MEARSQLRHRPTLTRRRRVYGWCQSFYIPRLLTVVNRAASTDFENIGKISILNEVHFTMTLNLTRTPLLASLLMSATCLTAQITPAPVPYASVSELNSILGPLEQASQATRPT